MTTKRSAQVPKIAWWAKRWAKMPVLGTVEGAFFSG